MSYVDSHSKNIIISKDENLEQDPYFYKIQEKLHQIRNDVNSFAFTINPNIVSS